MVEVVWTTGAVEDIQTAQLKPFMFKYLFNRYRKDKDLDNLVTEYNMTTNMENKLDQKELPKKNFITFSNIWAKAYKEVGKMDIAELAEDYIPESEFKVGLKLNRDYPSVLVEDAKTPKGVAEFSGYSTSKNYPRDEEYPEGFNTKTINAYGFEEEEETDADPDKPKKFSMLQEALIDGNYVITKKDFNELYTLKGLSIKDFKDGKLGQNAKGEKTLTPSEITVKFKLDPDSSWSRKFLKKSGFMPQMEDFAYVEDGSNKKGGGRKEYTTSQKEPRLMQDKKWKKDVPYFAPELMANADKQIEYSAGVDRRNKQIDDMRIHDSATGMRFRNMLNARRNNIIKGNRKLPEQDEILGILVKTINELDMYKLIGNSILKNPMLITDAKVELKISSAARPKDNFVINTITIDPTIKKIFFIKPVKKLLMETMPKTQPMKTPSSLGVAYGKDKNKVADYWPSLKSRERLIKSIKVRYSELDDIKDALKERADEIKEELNQDE